MESSTHHASSSTWLLKKGGTLKFARNSWGSWQDPPASTPELLSKVFCRDPFLEWKLLQESTRENLVRPKICSSCSLADIALLTKRKQAFLHKDSDSLPSTRTSWKIIRHWGFKSHKKKEKRTRVRTPRKALTFIYLMAAIEGEPHQERGQNGQTQQQHTKRIYLVSTTNEPASCAATTHQDTL